MDPERFVMIRDYKPGDEVECYEIVREGTMSTVNTAFIAGLTREFTFQIMVLASAVMFIFVGLPFGFCLASIPGVIVFMYFCVWSGHLYKAVEINKDMFNIPRIYMSSEHTGFWVAEAYEPEPLTTNNAKVTYKILTEQEAKHIKTSRYFKKIVGTIAVTRSKSTEGSAWLRRMAVTKRYRRKGVATGLLNEALRFCQDKDYTAVELLTTECHDNARQFYVKNGFELKHMYHKRIFGNFISVLMYELFYKFRKNKLSVPV